MVSFEEARQRILAAIQPLPDQPVPLGQACGRFVSQPIYSSVDLPPADNSAMDGYAVRAADLACASPQSPVRLRVAGRVPAGTVLAKEIQPGCCARLFTGSILPAGADAVVMQEETRVGPERPEEVLFLETVRRGENVRFRGEDVKKNDLLAAPGQRLNAARLSLLAAAGVTTVHCFRRPVIGLLATGNELREPGARLEAGAIFESNRIGLAALARQMGAQPKSYPLVGDSVEKIQAALKQAFLECDIVATSGGASVGEMDLVRSAFCGLGGQLDFWKVAMRPGKPLAFGALEGKCLAALPGNPVSALVTFFLFVCPALLRLQGDSQARLPVQKAALGQALKNDSERRHFMQVIIDSEGAVRPLARQASHRLKPAAEAVGLVEVPPLATLEAGTLVSVLGWGL